MFRYLKYTKLYEQIQVAKKILTDFHECFMLLRGEETSVGMLKTMMMFREGPGEN